MKTTIADGSLEAIKWLGLVAMTIDHLDRHVFASSLPGAFEFGRVAMPLFGFVLAYNLARPGTLVRGAYRRTLKRLAIYGLISAPLFWFLVGPWPLNILFTLAAATIVFELVERGGWRRYVAAVALVAAAGALVEFFWFALAFCYASWRFARSGSVLAFSGMLLSAASLYIVNQNWWAMAAVLVILAARHVSLDIKRRQNLFYLFYPAHLAAIIIIQQLWSPTNTTSLITTLVVLGMAALGYHAAGRRGLA